MGVCSYKETGSQDNQSISTEKMKIDIVLTYLIPYGESKVRIFGTNFVKNNKNKCFLQINDIATNSKTKHELSEYLDISIVPHINNKDSKTFEISLVQTDYFTDMSYMFFECIYFMGTNEISKLKTEKVTNMSSMFVACKYLTNLKDIGELDTNKVTDMSLMFDSCFSLKDLPDLSKWNTSRVISMNAMFEKCLSLEKITGMEKWDVSNVKECNSFI